MNHVQVRELRPGEFAVLDAVFAGLSATSRYRRFHGPVPRLTRRARERLAAVDGRRHIAVAAFVRGKPVGIARLVGGAADGPADLAVEVIDALQHKGIGTRILRAVVELGCAAGMRALVADVLAENTAMHELLVREFPFATQVRDGAELTYTVDLTRSTCAPAGAAA